MRLPYSYLPGIDNSSLYPLLPVWFINKEHEALTLALVDSGATNAAISTALADDLGIDWKKIPPVKGFAAGGSFVSHPARIKIKIFDEEFMVRVHIVENLMPYDAILGQNDLFQRAKITFEAYKKQFSIEFREFN